MVAVSYVRNTDSGYRLFNEPVTPFFAVKLIHPALIVLPVVACQGIDDDAG